MTASNTVPITASNTLANSHSVSSSAPQCAQVVHLPQYPFRFVVFTAAGDKTSITMPPALVAVFVEGFGTREAFRDALLAVSKAAEPSPGYSRSLLVRMALAAQLKSRAQGNTPASL